MLSDEVFRTSLAALIPLKEPNGSFYAFIAPSSPKK
jgi:hypothetical protein